MFKYFALIINIKGAVLMPAFLSVMGANTFNLLHSLVQTDKLGGMSGEDIVKILGNHYFPRPMIITAIQIP